MLSFLAWRRMEQISQPVVLVTSYAIVWQVPNIAQNKLTVYMIKALPFTPIECIFQQSVPLTHQKVDRLLQEFATDDKEYLEHSENQHSR